MITPEEIKEIRKLIEAATPADKVYLDRADFDNGESAWELHGRQETDMFVAFSTINYGNNKMCAKFDAEFWLAARTLVPRLLDEVERLQGLLGIDKWYMQKNFEASQGMLDVIKKERDQTYVKLAAAMNVVDAAKIMRIYCLGSDVSTKNMLAQFDAVLAALDRSKK